MAMTHSISGKCIPTVMWERRVKLAPFFSSLLSHAGNRGSLQSRCFGEICWGFLRIEEVISFPCWGSNPGLYASNASSLSTQLRPTLTFLLGPFMRHDRLCFMELLTFHETGVMINSEWGRMKPHSPLSEELPWVPRQSPGMWTTPKSFKMRYSHGPALWGLRRHQVQETLWISFCCGGLGFVLSPMLGFGKRGYDPALPTLTAQPWPTGSSVYPNSF